MKHKFSIQNAQPVANLLLSTFKDSTTKIQIVGSIRRKKEMVGDVEILIIPKLRVQQADELFPSLVNLFEEQLKYSIKSKILSFREKKDGTTANGPKVKLLRHVETNLPIDIFITNQECWYSSLVCRTGGKDNNAMLASKAKSMGWRWLMGGPGFQCTDRNNVNYGKIIPFKTEQEAYDFLNIPFLPPEQRP